jgi:predicted RNase H-like HicB family nuclease
MDQSFLAILMPEDSGGWTVVFPDLPGCATHGATVQEAQAKAAEGLDIHLATMREGKKRQFLSREICKLCRQARSGKRGAGSTGQRWLSVSITTGRTSDAHHAT